MIRNKILILILTGLFLLAGCNGGGDQQSNFNTIPLTVEFQTEPEDIKAGQEVIISVRVLQGEDVVNDASDVQFEVWTQGNDDHEFIYAEFQGEGIYSISKTFTDPGVYYVMYHVTAREFHSMERMELIVN